MNSFKEKGITLIALIITVIILLILAGTAISIAVNGEDLFGKTTEAREQWNSAVETENTSISNVLNLLNILEPSTRIRINNVDKEINKNDAGNYYGKVVTNYSNAAQTAGKTSVNGVTVSTTYRLYYIDYDGKYGEKGTIYLKADCTDSVGELQTEVEPSGGDAENSPMKKLNPLMYSNSEYDAPDANLECMKNIRWLTNPQNWQPTLELEEFSSKTNYIIGAPTVEMMFDSYNEHYKPETFDTSSRSIGGEYDRTELRYTYPMILADGTIYDIYNNKPTGYIIGPNSESRAVNGMYTGTNSSTIITDSEIDSTYYPGMNKGYWLASPAAYSGKLYEASGTNAGHIKLAGSIFGRTKSFCPIVSLKPDTQLVLE